MHALHITYKHFPTNTRMHSDTCTHALIYTLLHANTCTNTPSHKNSYTNTKPYKHIYSPAPINT